MVLSGKVTVEKYCHTHEVRLVAVSSDSTALAPAAAEIESEGVIEVVLEVVDME